MENLKEKILNQIDRINKDLIKLSQKIHSNPELCFKEYKAANWLKEITKKHGFSLEYPVGGLDTAFKARFKGKKEGPQIAFLAEYDALKGKGHACGHNIIAACATGAAIGLSKVIDQVGGEVILLGTPAEEGGGGKIILLNEGVFDHIDYGLMIHPGSKNLIGRGGLAAVLLDISFKGKAAHSSNPSSGINALKALLEVFKGIDTIRVNLKDEVRINGIITDGGQAPNIIPDYASGEFVVRAETKEYLKDVVKKIIEVTEAAQIMTGAEPTVKEGLFYAERYPNLTMAEKFKENMELLSEEFFYPDPNMSLGSSDIGNVSLKIPVIHSYLKLVDQGVNAHSTEFKEASVSKRAEEIIIKAAKGLALTGYDILTDKKLRKDINNEFIQTVKGGQNEF